MIYIKVSLNHFLIIIIMYLSNFQNRSLHTMYKAKEVKGKGVYRDSVAIQVLLIVPGFRQIVQPPGTIDTARQLRPPTLWY